MSEIVHPVVEEPVVEEPVRVEEYRVLNARPQEVVIKDAAKPKKIIRPWYEMIDRR